MNIPGETHDLQRETTELFRRTLSELAAMLRDGALSSRTLLDHYLERIARLNAQLNAFVFLDLEGARRAADESDRRLRAGRPRSALEGVPVAIKDNLLVRGQAATWGSRLFAEYVPDHDEIPVALLRAAGAVLLGKTNVPEFTLRGYTDNPVFGVTRNPWHPALTPGGSSGGAVAAVAAGLVPLALCTDGGGSIRRPAAHTGLVGLKPSIGRIPRGEGFPAILLDCEVAGPIARTVDDIRVALSVLAVAHPADPRSRGLPALSSAHRRPEQLRILFVERFGDAPVDRKIIESCERAVRNLQALGHQVTSGPLPFSIDDASAAWGKVGDVGLALLAARNPRFVELVSEPYVNQASAGAKLSAVEYLGVIESLNGLRTETGRTFQSVDIIVTPTTAAQPWPAQEVFPPVIDGREAGPRGHAVFTGWVNACGHPAISIPIDPARDGMPIGLQLVGDFGADALLLDVADSYERAHPWAERWPPLALS